MNWKRVILIVLDSVGIGALPDAASYGDEGAHTLGHIAERMPDFELPTLARLGLGRIDELRGIEAVSEPQAYYGKMAEVSAGKDTMTGHWELMGLRIEQPFRTYPDGFPPELLAAFSARTGRGVVCNAPASGTEVLDEFGPHHMATGDWIVYTSADSVLQIAAHEAVVPLGELYRACEIARELTLDERFLVGRVIARPFVGSPGSFTRTSNRHDYAVAPPAPTLLDALQASGLETIAVGKINDIFSGQGISRSFPTKSNMHGMDELMHIAALEFRGLCFANLVDFDSLYGHRRDVKGYAQALQEFDRRLPALLERFNDEDLLIITADHGNDPTHPGTDHTREYVPLLVYSPLFAKSVQTQQTEQTRQAEISRSLGTRATFADLSATIAELFGVNFPTDGSSFFSKLQTFSRSESQ